MLQADNKEVSNKLAEKIAAERAKALLKSMENKKRPAEDSLQVSGGSSTEAQKSKKTKKDKDKDKSKKKKKKSKD